MVANILFKNYLKVADNSMFAFIAGFCLILQLLGAPIDDYVWRFDPNYKWEYLGANYDLHGVDLTRTKSWTGYVLNVTSLKWLTDEDFAPSSQAKSIWYFSANLLFVIIKVALAGGNCSRQNYASF